MYYNHSLFDLSALNVFVYLNLKSKVIDIILKCEKIASLFSTKEPLIKSSLGDN